MEHENGVTSKKTLISIAVIAAAVLLRLCGLGAASLTANEAEAALAALHLFDGSSGNLLYSLPTAVVFKMFGDSEFTARLFPALMGILLAVLPLCLKRRIGERKALLLAFLMAVDPTLLFWSKRADALIPAAALCAAAAVCFMSGKYWGGLFFFLCSLCGGDRCIPAVLAGIAAGVLYCLVRKYDPRSLLPASFGKQRLLLLIVCFLLTVTAFGAFPGGISLLGSGIAASFGTAPRWAYPGIAAIAAAIIVYLGIPCVLCIWRSIREKCFAGACCFILFAAGLILWRGVLAFPWLALLLEIAALPAYDHLIDALKGARGFAFYAAAGVTVAAWGVFYFRLVELFSQRNGNDLIQITLNGTVQTLPLSRFAGSVLLTVLSVVIIVLVLKILLGFFESASVRRGILCGLVIVCGWGLVSNLWNSGGFDRDGDHPASPHLKNTYHVLNGTSASLMNSSVFGIIRDTAAKHGDTTGKPYGLNLIPDDVLLTWQLRKYKGIVINANTHTDLTGIDLILSQSGMSYEENGYVGAAFPWRSTMNWTDLSFQDWGKWLIFGDASPAPDSPLTIWVKGSYIYSSAETE